MNRAGRILALALLPLAAGARADSKEDLLEILALHEKLATNEAFQQQAKMLGVYLEEARTMSADQRALVHRKVLGILRQIAEAPPRESQGPAKPSEALGEVLESGAAALEWFKADSLDAIPESPVRRTLWKRDLTAAREGEDADLPRKPDASRVARISFYFEAKGAGKHEFVVQHGGNAVRLLIGGSQVVDLKTDGEKTGRGVADLEQGFHRVDVLLKYVESGDPSFTVSVLPPDALEGRILTQSDLFLKRSALPKE